MKAKLFSHSTQKKSVADEWVRHMDERGSDEDGWREEETSIPFASFLVFSGWRYTRRQHEWCTTLCFSHNFIQPDHGPQGNPWQMYASANFKLVARKRGLSEVEDKRGAREVALLNQPESYRGKCGNCRLRVEIYWKLRLGRGCAWRSKRVWCR